MPQFDPPPDFLPPFRANSGSANATQAQMYAQVFGVQRETATLDVNGEATWLFAVPFSFKPTITHIYEEAADNPPLILKVKSFTMVNSKFASVTVKAYRLRNLPVLDAVSGILTAVITGVNAIVTALSGYSIFTTTGLSGLAVHLTAGPRSSSAAL